MRTILLGITGSVAATTANKMAAALRQLGEVVIVATECGSWFLSNNEPFPPDHCEIYFDADEWQKPYKKNDPILHIELRRRASYFVIAPLSANTMAKLTHGLCDNLLTSIYRAWDPNKPVILAPAMNTYMWENEITEQQLGILKKRYDHYIIDPVEKTLACGDIGMGAMANITDIAACIVAHPEWCKPMGSINGIPVGNHPGAFGFRRKHDVHTGVDLYTNPGENVYAMEPGRVIKIGRFTGPSLGHTWWNETAAVMIEGPSGVINYGEITPAYGVRECNYLNRGNLIGQVKPVLPQHKHRPDIPGHSTSMLHIELYDHNYRGEWVEWPLNGEKPPALRDPTSYLQAMLPKLPILERD